MPHCSSFKKSNSKQINNLIEINSSATTFYFEKEYEIKKIVKDLTLELTLNYIYNRISKNFIYFPDFFIVEGTFDAVVFGINLEKNLPVAVKVQKSSTKEDQLKKESEILALIKNDIIFPTLYLF